MSVVPHVRSKKPSTKDHGLDDSICVKYLEEADLQRQKMGLQVGVG